MQRAAGDIDGAAIIRQPQDAVVLAAGIFVIHPEADVAFLFLSNP